MTHPNVWRKMAERYHGSLPEEIRRYLKSRGISDPVIDAKLLGWTGRRISIPVLDRFGNVISFRYGKAPADTSDSPKMLSLPGACPELYGAEVFAENLRHVVICEGEYDRLVLASQGIPAVTSTAGARTFLTNWAPLFQNVKRIFICLDRDRAGEEGARVVKSVLPRAVIMRLPDAVGEGGDVTDFFVRLQNTRLDFDVLLATAAAEEEEVPDMPPVTRSLPRGLKRKVASKAERLKRDIPLARVASFYTPLRASGVRLVGPCPFHEEKSASFTIYPATDTYYCFGCGAHGDVIRFLMDKESKTFGQALEALEHFRSTDELFPTVA